MSRLSKESSLSSVASTSQEGQEEEQEEAAGLPSNRILRVTLLSSEWKSSKGGLSTINRELAIQLAKQPNVEVSVYLPHCSEKDKEVARSLNVELVEAEELPGFDPIDWLNSVPKDHVMDCVVGHGIHLGRQIPLIKRQHPHCKWIQVVHTAPEELGMFKCYADAISKGEKKHQIEVELCERADQVVAVGPKLADAYSRYLRSCQKDQDVLKLTPSIFTEFSEVKQASEERNTFHVLVFGRGDSEDFKLKGYDIAAQAIAKLEEKSYKLMFVGAPSGKEVEIAEKLIQCGIPGSQLTVRCFNESREWLAKLFCEVDLAIMPSRTEGFGLTALEALSSGLPVLVSGNSGLGEALRKVPTGSNCVVDSEDPKDWAKEIRAVRQKDRDVRLIESKLLCEKYLEKYSWQESCGFLVEKMCHLTFGSLQSTVSSVEKKKRPSPHIEIPLAKRLREDLTDRREDDRSTSTENAKRPPSSLAFVQPPKQLLRPEVTDHSEVYDLAVKLLRDEYSRLANLKPLIWENDSHIHLPLNQVYTTLKIKHRTKPYFKLTDQVVQMYDIFNSVDESCPLTEGSTNNRNRMVLVEGSPGMGKTTFSIKMANDWAMKTIPEVHDFPLFQLVLLLKCRDFDGDVMQAISDQLLPEDMKDNKRKELMDYIGDVENQDKILLILDGLDELPRKVEKQVDKLLKRKVMPQCFILVTSREERGIQVRQRYDFDIILQIKGFTKENASEYVKKHFKIVDHEKGERLVQAFEENTLLDALRNNPLNLLLLCIVFEDHEGELPSSATELYQIIVCCLLRRFCVKHNLEIPDNNRTLEKQFEDSLLALGELAWRCLLEDRLSFREQELAKFESIIEGLQARNLGLVFKEASVKKINPQHEYHFFHKTFQEYLAAFYLAMKLLREEINVFDEFQLTFDDIPVTYRQVFLFVSGILGDQASILFRQIGQRLDSRGLWDWLKCSRQEATFFAESFSESGNAEIMATVLCSFIPFPQTVEIVNSKVHLPWNLVTVFNACKNFPQIQQPVNLIVPDTVVLKDHELRNVVPDLLAPCLQPKTLSISADGMNSSQANALCKILSADSTLCSFTLKMFNSIPSEVAAIIGDGLAANRTLTTIKFQLIEEEGEAWASALEKGLSAEAPPESVVLKICGSMSDIAMQALKKIIANQHLASLVLEFYGEIQDLVVAAVGEGIAEETTLTTLTLIIYGNLSYSGAICLERCFRTNSSLKKLEVKAYGQLPENWLAIVKNGLLAEKPGNSYTFYPNPQSEVSATKIAQSCHDFVATVLNSEHSLTLNLWGELSRNGAEAVEKLFKHPLTPSVILNIHGNVTRDMAICLARTLEPHKTLSSLTINIWGELTRDGNTVLQEIPHGNQKLSFVLNVHELSSSDWICEDLDFLVAAPSHFSSLLAKVIKKRIRKLILTVKYHSDMKRDWSHGLGDSLARSEIATLMLTINNHSCTVKDGACSSSDGLGGSISLSSVVHTVNNCSESVGDDCWGQSLGDGLARSDSLTSLSLTINNHGGMSGDWTRFLGDGLAKNMSLITLSLTVNNYSDMNGGFGNGLGYDLARNTSLTTLSLTINDYSGISDGWVHCLYEGLSESVSLTTLNLVINYQGDVSVDWGRCLGDGLAGHMSLTTLSLSVNDQNSNWIFGLSEGVATNTSLSTLSLTFNNYIDQTEDCVVFLFRCLQRNRSLTTLCFTIYNQNDTDGKWAFKVGESLVLSTSVTTFNLTINNYNGMSEGWIDALFDGLSSCMEDSCVLAVLSLTINNFSGMSGYWASRLGSLPSCINITTFSLTINNYCYTSGDWGQGLVDGLARSPSLTDVSLTFTNYCKVSEDWLDCILRNIAVRRDSFSDLRLSINDYSDTSGNFGYVWQNVSR